VIKASASLFWGITHTLFVVSYQRFGTTYGPILTLKDGNERFSRNLGH